MGGELDYRRDGGQTHFVLTLALAPEIPSGLETQEVVHV
jgi:hypothetical protein